VLRKLKNLDWKRMFRDFRDQMKDDNVFNGAAALGFYLMLAIFPALMFLLSLLPYLPVQDLDKAIMDVLHEAMPGDAASRPADVDLTGRGLPAAIGCGRSLL
jgi:membrane protein